MGGLDSKCRLRQGGRDTDTLSGKQGRGNGFRPDKKKGVASNRTRPASGTLLRTMIALPRATRIGRRQRPLKRGTQMAIRLTCVAMLVCPLMFAASGCSSLSRRMPVAGVEASQQSISPHDARLMQLAQRYEKQGNTEGALRIYRKLQATEADIPEVTNRITALNGQNPASPNAPETDPPRVLTPVANAAPPRGSTAEPEVARKPVPAQPAERLVTSAQPRKTKVAALASAHTSERSHSAVTEDSDSSAEDYERPAWAGGSSVAAKPDVATSSETAAIAEVCDVDAADCCETRLSDSVADSINPFEAPLDEEHRWAHHEAPSVETPVHNDPLESLPPKSEPIARAEAAWEIYETTGNADQAVVVLTGLLSESESDVVELSMFLLGRMGEDAEAASSQLVTMRDNGDGSARLHAAEALARISSDDVKSVAILVDGLLKGDPESRWLCALALANVGTEHQSLAVNALILALNDVDPTVRSVAALSLGGMGQAAQAAVPQLRETSHDSSAEVRDAAITALACIRR